MSEYLIRLQEEREAREDVDEPEQTGAICGDGMCPYVPCKDYPKCIHIKKILEELKKDEREGLSEISKQIDNNEMEAIEKQAEEMELEGDREEFGEGDL